MSYTDVPTPHISAMPGDIAETVLMPGDPLRAKYVAETYFDDPVQFNSTRGMLGYTGTYKGKRISVMGSGMGMPSIGIYSYELFNFYGVKNIIRIGSAGGIHPDVKLYDIIISLAASYESNYANQYGLNCTFAPGCSFTLLEKAVAVAREKGIPVKVGNTLSADLFYNANPAFENFVKIGFLSVEMEAAALYMNAAYAGANALCLATVSDVIATGETTTAEERQTALTKMMDIALELA